MSNWWSAVLAISGVNVASFVCVAFWLGSRLGAITQRIEDIDTKGCEHRRNGCT